MRKHALLAAGIALLVVVAGVLVFMQGNGTPGQGPTDRTERFGTDGSKTVAIVVPVTVRAITSFVAAARERLEQEGVAVIHLSAEGDPSKFQTVLKAAILKKPDVIITFGTQLTDTALGPQFRANLPPLVGSALSAPEEVPNLASVGVDPPRKAKVAVISDSPREDIYAQSAAVLSSLLPRDQQHIGILYNESEINSRTMAESLRRAFEATGKTVHPGIVSGAQDVDKVAKALILKGCGALVLPHDKYVLPQAGAIVKLAITDRAEEPIMVFSLDDGVVRDSGVPVSVSVNYSALGTMSAETCLDILAGDDPSQMPVQAPQRAAVYVNEDALARAGVALPVSLQGSVIFVGDDKPRD